jgi:hypothetical protein
MERNAYAVLRLNVGKEDGVIVGTVRLRTRFWNIAVAGVSLLLLVTLVGYFFSESVVYRPWPRKPGRYTLWLTKLASREERLR